jgi:hypothetical protein
MSIAWTCPSCGNQGSVDSARLSGKRARLRCRRCDTSFPLKTTTEREPAPRWYVLLGPLDEQQLRDKLREGQLAEHALVKRAGESRWLPAALEPRLQGAGLEAALQEPAGEPETIFDAELPSAPVVEVPAKTDARRDELDEHSVVMDFDQLEGPQPEGSQLDGSQLDGSQLDGSQLDGSQLEGPQLEAAAARAQPEQDAIAAPAGEQAEPEDAMAMPLTPSGAPMVAEALEVYCDGGDLEFAAANDGARERWLLPLVAGLALLAGVGLWAAWSAFGGVRAGPSAAPPARYKPQRLVAAPQVEPGQTPSASDGDDTAPESGQATAPDRADKRRRRRRRRKRSRGRAVAISMPGARALATGPSATGRGGLTADPKDRPVTSVDQRVTQPKRQQTALASYVLRSNRSTLQTCHLLSARRGETLDPKTRVRSALDVDAAGNATKVAVVGKAPGKLLSCYRLVAKRWTLPPANEPYELKFTFLAKR